MRPSGHKLMPGEILRGVRRERTYEPVPKMVYGRDQRLLGLNDTRSRIMEPRSQSLNSLELCMKGTHGERAYKTRLPRSSHERYVSERAATFSNIGAFTSLSCSRPGIGLLAQEDPIKSTLTRPTRSWFLLLPLTLRQRYSASHVTFTPHQSFYIR
jgi:hypothetical protein